MSYTYNMKIAVLDKSENIVTLNIQLWNEIKSHLCKLNTHIIEYNKQPISVDVMWHKLRMNHVSHYLCGDLFSKPSCEIDAVIFEHTVKTIQRIEEKYKHEYKIVFYISRIITR